MGPPNINNNMNFSTLQRPTYQELERRRQVRDEGLGSSGPTSNGTSASGSNCSSTELNRQTAVKRTASSLQRKDSVLSRGFNALVRRQSMAVANPSKLLDGRGGNARPEIRHLKSQFSIDDNDDVTFMPPQLPTYIPENDNTQTQQNLRRFLPDDPPLSMMTNGSSNMIPRVNQGPMVTNLSRSRSMAVQRTKSFKHPEKGGHIPPPEILRLRSKSQARDNELNHGLFGNSANLNSSGYEDSDEILYTSGGFASTQTDNSSSSGGKEGKSALTVLKNKLNAGFGGGSRLSRQASLMGGNSGYGQAALWLAREKYLLQNKKSNYNPNYGYLPGANKPRRRDLSEPPPPPPRVAPPLPGKRRQPLPDIFYYGNRYTGTPNISQRASMEAINAQNLTSMRPDPLINPDDISSFEDSLLRPIAMVSRRKILSRSRDDLNLDSDNLQDSDPNGDLNPYNYRNNRRINLMDSEDDVWYHKDKLYKDHIQEVLDKWESIDDEIWAKVIVLERNRRVAKAYARAPVLTINGNNDGFDGFRIGMNGFDNPMRDQKTEDIKALIGQGCKVKMDGTGNILVKRLARSPVYVKNTVYEENAVSNDILKLPNSGLLEPIDKPFKLFDMKKFQQNVNREMKRPFPDRRKLEVQCVSAIAFVKNEPDLLDSPIWIMLINVVALEMLKAKMPGDESIPNSQGRAQQANGRGANIRNNSEPRKKYLASGSSDEDPYSLTPSGSSGSSGKGKGDSAGGDREGRNRKGGETSGSNRDSGHGSGSNGERERSGGPRLPQKEKDYYGPQNWAKNNHMRDYSDDMEDREMENFKTLQKKKDRITSSDGISSRNRIQQLMESANGVPPIRARYRNGRKNEAKNNDSEHGKNKNDDPYYCGMRARVPNFANGTSNGFNNNNKPSKKENLYKMNGGVKGKLARNSQQNGSPSSMSNSNSAPNLAQLPGAAHPFWWHSRLYPDSGASPSPMSNGHNGFPMAAPMAFRTSAADLSNYHYPGRNRGYHLGGGPVSSPVSGGLTTGPHRPAVFRTGWE